MGLSLLLKNVEQLGGSWQRAAQISLYLKLDAGSRDGEALRDEIKGMPGVADAQYVSREQALEEFQQQSDWARPCANCQTTHCRVWWW